MSAHETVADSKRAFHAAFPHVIAPLHRRMVDELLVELHLLSRQQGFRSDSLFAVGLIQVFDAFAKGYRPEQHRQALLGALCSASGFDADELRRTSQTALDAMGCHTLAEVKSWIEAGGTTAPEPLAGALASIRRPDFHYSRLMAVGLLSLMERAAGADELEPQALREHAHDLAAAMGLMRDRVDKDLNLYTTNLVKMAQAVELMEETIAAERRRRERQQQESLSGSPEAAPSGG